MIQSPTTPGGTPVSAYAHLDVHFEVTNLIGLDLFGKNDPFVVAHVMNTSNKWVEQGRTQTVWNSHDCSFGECVRLRVLRSGVTGVKFEVWDRNGHSDDLSTHHLIGSTVCTSTALLRGIQGGKPETFQLVHPKRPLAPDGISPSGALTVIIASRPWNSRLSSVLILEMSAVITPHVVTPPILQFELQRQSAQAAGVFLPFFRSMHLENLHPSSLHAKNRAYRIAYNSQRTVTYEHFCNFEDGQPDANTPLRIVIYVVETHKNTRMPALRHSIPRGVGFVYSSLSDLLDRDNGSLRVPISLTVPHGGRLPFGTRDAPEARSARNRKRILAVGRDIQISFSTVTCN